jgi:DNA transposition AAA+ family ATPase
MNATQQEAERLALVPADETEKALAQISTAPDCINISGDTVARSTQHLPEDQRALVRWSFDYAREKGWSWAETSHQFNCSRTTLYRVWADKYRYDAKHPRAGERVPLDSLCADLVKVRRKMEELDAIGRLPFVETSAWHKINKVCETAMDSNSVAMIYGESQIGKTECLNEFRRRNNHGTTKLVRMPASAGVQLVMREFARACRISPESNFDKLRDRVFRAVDHTNLVLVDEVHQAFVSYQRTATLKVMEVMRELHDRTGCALVLCGTRVWRDQLETGPYAQFLKQLRRRGALELQLPDSAPVADLVLIARHYGLPAPTGDASELVNAINAEFGLGRFIKFLGIGARHALKRKEKYQWDHFMRAYDILAKLKGGGR